MSLELTLKQQVSIPLEVDPIRLETVRELSVDQIKKLTIFHGNKQPELGEFFDVKGSAEDQEMVWMGDCSKVKLIGTHLDAGTVRVEGNAGMHLGAEMTGGQIIVSGDAADWVGAEMHGGRIHIKGNAGHLVGAVYRGGRRGMTGGEILIEGNAGNEIGHTMRRGLIAVRGNAGDAVGFNMIAGTILVFGSAGIRHGAGMRRGTIGILGSEGSPDILPTFKAAGRTSPLFLTLYLKHLQEAGFEVPEIPTDLQKYAGDFLELGKGELLIPHFAA
ncbi:MAG: formylmethanofuran dehydrogenase subunit C [Planctomycetaceae bacterium]|nr:formylmethanofuran dehydrogenase subunit C [Planctomycetaceae bacterium]